MLPQKEFRTDASNRIEQLDERLFDRLQEGFRRAAGAGCTHVQYLIAGYAVDLRIAGEQLASQVTRAFAHLETVKIERPALTVELWDEVAAGVAGQMDWTPQPETALVTIRASDDDRFVCEQRPCGVELLDRSAHRIIGCTRSAGQRYLDERARPLHRLLSTWLNDRGVHFVHAGLVSWQGRGVLFGGHGGAGKSTSSIACLRAGFRYLGDDSIGFEQLDDGSFRGYGLFATGVLEVDHMNRFADLLPHALPPYHSHESKAVFYPGDIFPGAMLHKTRIRAIALPRVVDGEETRVERVSRAEALFTLAPTSVMQLAAPTTRSFHALAQLVDGVPAYRLHLGRDIEKIPDVVRQLASELEAPFIAEEKEQS